MKWLEEVNREHKNYSEVMTFDDYLNHVEKNYFQELRSCAQYLLNMFEYFGQNEDGGFSLFSKNHPDAPPVYGQIKSQQKIYQSIKNFINEGHNNKFLLLIGPNGSSKSTLIKKMMLAAEDYANSDQGALYTFSWVFPIDHFVKGSLGLGSATVERNLKSYAHLEDKDISAILPSELKDHPLLLIPKDVRQKLITKCFQKKPKDLENIKKTYLYNGDLSQKNRQILEALLKNNKGSYDEVYKYVRVERFYINRRYSRGATTIEPQLHVDAQIQQITMDRRLASLPPSLQSINLFQMSGEVVLANRGMLEYSDLLKRPLDTFKYLLMTMESKTINIQGILTELDIFFVGSSNEIHFSAFKQHPDFNSFKGRFTFIKVPYLTNYKEEVCIYDEQLNNLKEKCNFEPQSLESLCMWSVFTRLRAPHARSYKDDKLGHLAEAMNPLDKALFYANKNAADYLDSESRQILKHGAEDILREYENDPMYEGKFGVSPREVKEILYELSSRYKSVTFVEVIEYLKEFSEKKGEYDFLNITAQGQYHNYFRFLELIQEYYLNMLDLEVRDSLGLIDERSYEDYLSRYILNINALIKGEKIKNMVTGKFETSDSYFIKEFESNINLTESADKFRSNLIARLGAFSLDNPGKKIIYTEIFNDLVASLQESFRNEQQKLLIKVGKNLVLYLAQMNGETQNTLTEENRQSISGIVTNLTTKFKYSESGAVTLLQYLIKNRYHIQ